MKVAQLQKGIRELEFSRRVIVSISAPERWAICGCGSHKNFVDEFFCVTGPA
jgi:hypothetical protein